MRPPALPREETFTSPLRSPAVAARVGVWLGACFGIAFVTGLLSHWAQSPHPWITFPTRPAWGYRLTQGVHVAAGTAAVPLLLVKLWTVYPKLFARPPRQLREVLRHGAERASVAVLVAAAIFQLATGLANAGQWYPWGFAFRPTHYALGWIVSGALLVHVAVKLPIVRRALAADVEDRSQDRPGGAVVGRGLTRRGLLRSAWLAAGTAVLATAGSAAPALRRVSVLGVRSGGGPQGVPVNRSARAADVIAPATSSDYRLTVTYGGQRLVLTRHDLLAMPQHGADLPIACVEGWSTQGHWEGVPVRDLLDRVGAPAGCDVRVESLQPRGGYRVSVLPAAFADDRLSLLALSLDHEPLALDHGFPARLIAPDRPGVLQTKWVSRLDVLT